MVHYSYSELLYAMYEIICNSFDIEDVDDVLVDGHILTRHEYKDIIRNEEKEIKIDKFFFYIINKQRNILKFFDIINLPNTYYFITAEWNKRIKQHPNNLIEEFYEFLRFSEIPKNCDTLVHRLDYLWEVQQHLRNLKPGEHLILSGKPNHGKKWIACDAVTNLQIARIMDFRIFWLNMHNCHTLELILEKLMKLKIIIGDSRDNSMGCNYPPDSSIKNKIFCLKKELQKIFQQDKYKNSLLVLTGVQNQKVLETFQFYCKILVTTRFSDIYQFLPVRHRLAIPINNGFTNLEAEEYFQKFLNKDRLSDIEIKYIRKINGLCHGIPLILNIIAQRLTKLQFNISIHEDNWKYWIRMLRSNKLTFNELADIERPIQNISECAIAHFEQLVIFRYNINVPISILTKYWRSGSDMKTQKILVILKDAALIEIEPINNKLFCHINYVMYNFLINKFRNTIELVNMHTQLVNVYNVPEVLESRKKYYLPGFVDDSYFYEHIGYHLYECQMRDLLEKLYKDFGFIERKIRSTSLLNTINDLKWLHRSLIDWDSSKHFFEELICNFLPSVEEQILTSNETCLLQLALSWPRGLVKDEALRQAELLENHLWFEDIHKLRCREIVQVQYNITVAHFYTQDIVLFAMSDNTIILKDFNLAQNTIFKGHQSKIIDILTLDFDYFLSLDIEGNVKLWCLKHSQVLIHDQKWEIDEADENFNDFHRFHYKEEVCYSLQDIKSKDAKKIVLMTPKPNKYVEFLTELRLGNCDLYSYKYDFDVVNDSEILKYYYTYPSNKMTIDVKFNIYIDHLYFFISGCGEIVCENTKNRSNIEVIQEMVDNGCLIDIHKLSVEFMDDYLINKFIFVYENSVQMYEFRIIDERIQLKVHKLFVLADNYNRINYSILTTNKKCLILATNRGCSFYNIYKQKTIEININENVLLLDAITLNRTNDDYLVIFNTEKFQNFVYKWYVEQDNITFQLKRNSMAIDLPLQKDFKAVHDVNCDALDEFTVYSVIEKSKVRKTTCTNGSSTEYIYEPEITSEITKISTSVTCTIIACKDNSLHLIDVENKKIFFLKLVPFPITFVKCFDQNTIIISVHEKSDRNYLIVNENEWLNLDDISHGPITEAHLLYDNYILLLVNNNEYCILEISTAQIISSVIFDCSLNITKLVANSLFIYKGEASFYECDMSKQKVIMEEINPKTLYAEYVSQSIVTCFDVNDNKTKLVIGYENGVINVFRIPATESLLEQVLNVNFKDAINDLKFSPFAKPLLLIVLHDRIYFYNLGSAIKQLKIEEKQQSHTKFDPKCYMYVNSQSTKTDDQIKHDFCLWHNKIEHHDPNNSKNLILSRYKLVGNSPNKIFCNKIFTNFLAIDNENNIHYLRLLDFKKDKCNILG